MSTLMIMNSIAGMAQSITKAAAVSIMGLALSLGSAQAQQGTEQLLVIKDHKFSPEEITVPAGQKIKLVVHNQDSTPEEFESGDLKREKVIPGGAKATIFIGPLKPGRYKFVGEFHEATAKGVVIAK